VENAASSSNVRVTADALQIEPVVVAPVLAVPILLLLLILLLVTTRKKKK
jgi:sortase A